MMRRWFSLRVLWAALLALLLAAPPAPLVAASMVPGWLVGSLCLAGHDSVPDDHKAPADTPHVHCTLCQTGLTLGSPPVPWVLAPPAHYVAIAAASAATPWSGPETDRPYASRAPPRIG